MIIVSRLTFTDGAKAPRSCSKCLSEILYCLACFVYFQIAFLGSCITRVSLAVGINFVNFEGTLVQ